jgi:hypothetical protein
VQHDDVAARLLIALEQGDEEALASLIRPDAHLVVDTGDPTGGEQRGRSRVIRTLNQRLERHPDAALLRVSVNGRPGLAQHLPGGEVVAVLNLGLDLEGAIGELWMSAAPGKLAHWNRE